MTAVLGSVLLLAVLVAALLLIVRGLRPGRGAAPGLRELDDYASPARGPVLLMGLVSAVAVHGLVPAGGGIVTGAAVGLLFGLLAAAGARRVAALVGAVAGVVGVAGAVATSFVVGGCSPVPLAGRVVALVAVLLAGAVGAGCATLLLAVRPRSLLAMYGAVRVCTFLSAPLGVGLVAQPHIAWLVVVVAALLFGFGAWIAPGPVIGLSALAIGLADSAVVSVAGTPCQAGIRLDEVGAVVVYLLVSALLVALLRRLLQ